MQSRGAVAPAVSGHPRLSRQNSASGHARQPAAATGSRPGTSGVTLAAAAVSLAVLTPLAYAKRRLGAQLASRALQGDAALSGIGAATSLLALTAVALYHTLGWWWADRAAALIVAAIATAEAWHTAPHRQPPA
jgi:divalent metal cation (Fe/Co/Zn/Cd) transporter